MGTCYVAHTINYRGEAFHGVSISQSFIKGPPHDDVFAATDASNSPARVMLFSGDAHPRHYAHDRHLRDVTTSAAWAARGRGQGQGSVFANRFEGWAGQTIKGPVSGWRYHHPAYKSRRPYPIQNQRICSVGMGKDRFRVRSLPGHHDHRLQKFRSALLIECETRHNSRRKINDRRELCGWHPDITRQSSGTFQCYGLDSSVGSGTLRLRFPWPGW